MPTLDLSGTRWRKSSRSSNVSNCVEVAVLSGARWRKSSRSTNVSNCVEVAVLSGVRWRKSSRSTDNANCVEVAVTPGAVAVRDSKHPAGGALLVPPHAWTTFTTALRDDSFR